MQSGDFPRGIEVLVKKAAVDAAFRQLLLDRRQEAADAIHLALEPAEVAMLQSIPRDQLETTIAQTRLPDQYREVFLGNDAAAMLSLTEKSSWREHAKYPGVDGWDAVRGSRPVVILVRPIAVSGYFLIRLISQIWRTIFPPKQGRRRFPMSWGSRPDHPSKWQR